MAGLPLQYDERGVAGFPRDDRLTYDDRGVAGLPADAFTAPTVDEEEPYKSDYDDVDLTQYNDGLGAALRRAFQFEGVDELPDSAELPALAEEDAQPKARPSVSEDIAEALRFRLERSDRKVEPKVPEPAEVEQGLLERTGRGVADYGAKMGGDFFGSIATAGDWLERQFTDVTIEEQASRDDLLRTAQKFLNDLDFGYEPGKYTTPEDLLGAVAEGDVGNALAGIFELGLVSAPMIAGTLIPQTAIPTVMSLAEDFAQQAAQNNGRERADGSDIARGMAGAALEYVFNKVGIGSQLKKLGFNRDLLRHGLSKWVAGTGRTAASEAVTEAGQTAVTTYGTERGGSLKETAQAGAVGGLVGGALGGSVGGVGLARDLVAGPGEQPRERTGGPDEAEREAINDGLNKDIPHITVRPPGARPATPTEGAPGGDVSTSPQGRPGPSVPQVAPAQPAVPPVGGPAALPPGVAPGPERGVSGQLPLDLPEGVDGPVQRELPLTPAPVAPGPFEQARQGRQPLEPAGARAAEPRLPLQYGEAQLEASEVDLPPQRGAERRAAEPPERRAPQTITAAQLARDNSWRELATMARDLGVRQRGTKRKIANKLVAASPDGDVGAALERARTPAAPEAPQPPATTPSPPEVPAGARAVAEAAAAAAEVTTPKPPAVPEVKAPAAVAPSKPPAVPKAEPLPALPAVEAPEVTVPEVPAPAPPPRVTTDAKALTQLPRTELVQTATQLGVEKVKRLNKTQLATEIINRRKASIDPLTRGERLASDIAAMGAAVTPSSKSNLTERTAADEIAAALTKPQIEQAAPPIESVLEPKTAPTLTGARKAIFDRAAENVRAERQFSPRYRETAASANVDLRPLINTMLAGEKATATDLQRAIRQNNIVRRAMGLPSTKVATRKAENAVRLREALAEAVAPAPVTPRAQAASVAQQEYIEPLAKAESQREVQEVVKKAKKQLPKKAAAVVERIAKMDPDQRSSSLLNIVVVRNTPKGERVVIQKYSPEAHKKAHMDYGPAAVHIAPKGTEAQAVAKIRTKLEHKKITDLSARLDAERVKYGREDASLPKSLKQLDPGTTSRKTAKVFEVSNREFQNVRDYVYAHPDAPTQNLIGNLEHIAPPEFRQLARRLRAAFRGSTAPTIEFRKKPLPGRPSDALGEYIVDQDHIVMYDRGGVGTLLHELVHAATMNVSGQYRQQIDDLYQVTKNWLKDNNQPFPYGMESVHEFVAEAFTNPDFQATLRAIPIPVRTEGGNRLISAFTQFLDTIRNALGLRGVTRTVLDEIVSMDSATMMRESREATSKGFIDSELRGEILRRSGSRGFTKAVDTVAKYSRPTRRVIAKNANTLRQLDMRYRNRFLTASGENPFTRWIETFFAQSEAMNRHAERASNLYKDWTTFASKNADMETNMRDAMSYATIFNVDPTLSLQQQPVQVNPDAHARAVSMYQKLSPEAQDLMRRIKGHYKNEWELTSRMLVRNLMRTYDMASHTDQAARAFISDFRKSWSNPDPQKAKTERDKAIRRHKPNAKQDFVDDFGAAMAEILSPRQIRGFYIPLKRFGDWVVEVKARSDNVTMDARKVDAILAAEGGVMQFHNRRIVRDAQGNDTGKVRGRFVVRSVDFAESDLVAEQVRELVVKRMNDMVKSYNNIPGWVVTKKGGITQRDDATLGSSEAPGRLQAQLKKMRDRKKISQAQFESMSNALIELMPTTSLHMSQLHREGVAGASADHRRALAQHAVQNSYYLASLEYGWELNQHIAALKKLTRERADAGTDQTFETALIGHLQERMNAGEKLTQRHWATQFALNFGFVAYLGSFSYIAVNLTQYSYSVARIGARYGFEDGMNRYGKVYLDVGTAIGKGVAKHAKTITTGAPGERSRAFTSLSDGVRTALKQKYGDAWYDEMHDIIDHAIEQSIIDMTLAMDVRGAADFTNTAGGVTAGQKLRRGYKTGETYVMDVARFLPHAVELQNRFATLVTAYEYAKANPDKRRAPTLRQEVLDILQETQFVYSPVNDAKIMAQWGKFGQLAAPLMMFKKYPQGVYSMFATMVGEMVGPDATLETRKEAMRHMALFFGSQTLLAGAAASILIEPAMFALSLAGMLMGLVGLQDPDDPGEFIDDPEAAFVTLGNRMLDWFGAPEFVRNSVMYGVPNALGVDISGRLSLNDLLFFDTYGRTTQEVAMKYLWEAMGPIGGLFEAGFNVHDAAANGQPASEVLAKAPVKALRDLARGIVIADEGLLDSTGDQIMGPDNFSWWESVAQAAGFQPGQVARYYAQQGRKYDLKGRIEGRKEKLIARFINTHKEGDSVEAERQAILRFNQMNPSHAITKEQIERRLKGDVDKLKRREAGLVGRSTKEGMRLEAAIKQHGLDLR